MRALPPLAFAILRRVELRLIETVPSLAMEVTDLLLEADGARVVIEEPISQVRLRTLVRELDEEDIPRIQYRVVSFPQTSEEEAQRMQDVQGAKSLLLEIIRRVSFDWVLYRTSSRYEQRKLAEEAYTWLFQEDEDHPHWELREDEGKQITSFLTICEVLDMNPERIRNMIKKLTPQRVTSSGRPPGEPRQDSYEASVTVHAALPAEAPDDAGDTGSFY